MRVECKEDVIDSAATPEDDSNSARVEAVPKPPAEVSVDYKNASEVK